MFSLHIRHFNKPFFKNAHGFLSSLNSLKLECEKLASEKTEMQRHYVMVSKQHNEFKMSIF